MSKIIDKMFVKRKALLLNAASRVAAKKLVTGAVEQGDVEQKPQAAVIFDNVGFITSDNLIDNNVTVQGRAEIHSELNTKINYAKSSSLVSKARSILRNKESEEDVATLFKNAYLKSQK